MSNVSTAKNTSGSNFLDYIPVVSTIKSLVHLFQRCFASKTAQPTPTAAEPTLPARISLRPKSLLRDIVLLIPFIGNIIVGISDFSKMDPREKLEVDIQQTITTLQKMSPENRTTAVNKMDKLFKKDRGFMEKIFDNKKLMNVEYYLKDIKNSKEQNEASVITKKKVEFISK
jgi:hypothetical protein